MPERSATRLPYGGTQYNYEEPDGRTMSLTAPPATFDSAKASLAELEAFGVPAEPPTSSPEYVKWKAMVAKGIHFVSAPAALEEVPDTPTPSGPGEAGESALDSSGALPSMADASSGQHIWSGYFNWNGKGAYVHSTAYFIEPSEHSPSCEKPGSFVWDGIGGWYNEHLGQDGTAQGATGIGTHQAWWEVLPEEPQEGVKAVVPKLYATPGAWFEADTQYKGNDEYTFYLYNFANGDAAHAVGHGSPDANVSDFIVERPMGDNLFNFSSVAFQGFTNGKAFGDYPTQRLTLYNEAGERNASPSGISSKYAFTDKYEGCKGDETGGSGGGEAEGEVPSVTTGGASGVTEAAATLTGTVNPRNFATEYHFEYGTEAENFSASTGAGNAGSGSSSVPVSASISGLQPGTTYHYRLIANSATGTSVGGEAVFTTSGSPPPPPPAVTTEGASGIGVHVATLEASINPNGVDTHYFFEYGTSKTLLDSDAPAQPGNDAGAGSSPAKVAVKLSGLTGYTTYYYRIVASSSSGTSYGEEHEVKTKSAWALQSTPEVENASNMSGVSCSSAEACTAVGWYSPPAKKGQAIDTLAERWNGTAWAVQTTPSDESAEQSELKAVSCPSEKACVAVGSYHVKAADSQFGVFAESWNGKAWTYEKLPLPAGATEGAKEISQIYGVSCSSATACTAVGDYKAEKALFALVESWNGKTWTAERTPVPSGEETVASEYLTGISCPVAKDCIATGAYQREESIANGGGSFSVALAEQWNGKAWTLAPNPFSSEFSSSFGNVACVSSSSCTVIGGYSESKEQAIDGTGVSASERWNGTSWEDQQPIPRPLGTEISMPGLSCYGTTCAIVGAYRPAGDEGEVTMNAGLALWFNGTAWELEPPPLPTGSTNEALHGVSCTSLYVCTAVGQYNSSSKYFTLAERSQFNQE
ncbi:MAG: hypothetical protein ABR992_12175 [Solirubrobacteraceae bacterium]